MNHTQKILEQIDDEMSKMLGKNKKTDEQFCVFVSQKWQEMDNDKYHIHDAYILIGHDERSSLGKRRQSACQTDKTRLATPKQ